MTGELDVGQGTPSIVYLSEISRHFHHDSLFEEHAGALSAGGRASTTLDFHHFCRSILGLTHDPDNIVSKIQCWWLVGRASIAQYKVIIM